MKYLKPYIKYSNSNSLRKRNNEVKIGETVSFFEKDSDLESAKIRFVVLGIPEDIGVRANFGRAGASTAWKPALDSFLNQQSNFFLDGEDVIILGSVETEDLMRSAENLDPRKDEDLKKLRSLVEEIDIRVTAIIEKIISKGKIPIIIGGGHNNAYGNIKGSSLALKQKVNVINCDPHADFRPLEGRHSGNGFSYAYNEGFLDRYALVCMHEQYNTSFVLSELQKLNTSILYSTYEDVFVRETKSFTNTLTQNISFVKAKACGVEIDLDAITNVPSSAKTSSGISPIQARQYAYQCGKNLNALYFHIAEGAPVLAHLKADNKTGKLIAYLMSDFIKGVKERV